MVWLQLPAAVAPLSYLHYKLVNPLSSVKLGRKGIVEVPNQLECCSSSSSPNIPKYRLGATSILGGIDELRQELMPKHVAVILDGNGRWAKSRGLPIEHGHRAGSANLTNLIALSTNLGIKILSLYAFSTENWNRSQVEVNSLMEVFEDFIQRYVKDLIKRYNVRFSIIGDKARLPKSLQYGISIVEESSKENKGIHVVFALSYSGQYDIVQATKKIASKVEDGILRAKDIDNALLERHLLTNFIEFPNPDLLIRTSGEMRASNFMLWQLAYTELYFCNKEFPDFGNDELVEALVSFQRRHRRYGGDRED